MAGAELHATLRDAPQGEQAGAAQRSVRHSIPWRSMWALPTAVCDGQVGGASGFASFPLPASLGLAAELPVVALPGRDGRGWDGPTAQAWRRALLSWGWGAWAEIAEASGVTADEAHAYGLQSYIP